MKTNDVEFAIKYAYASLLRPERMPFLPPIIHLETTTQCNLACTICPRTSALSRERIRDDNRWHQNLSFEQFSDIVDQFDSLLYIRLHGLGEPLTNPNLVRFVSEASSLGINAEFTSNAVLLSPEKAEAFIKSGLSEITVSLDGATKGVYENIRVNAQFDTVIKNVRQFVAIRSKLNKDRPILRINMVVTTENLNELQGVLKIAKELNAAEFRASPIVPPYPNLNSLVPDAILWVKSYQRC